MTIVLRSDRSQNLTPAQVDGNFSYLKDGRSTDLYASDFGVVEDGETDNSAALLSIRTALRARMDRLCTLHFRGGHVRYTDNRWLRNIGSLRLMGNGVGLECISSSPTFRNSRVLDTSTPFFDEGDGVSGSPKSGYRIQSAPRLAQTLTFMEEGDAAGFAVGERVIVAGFDGQFGGFPPNARYFEWHTVTDVDTEANQISVLDPLIYDYDAGWPDLSDSDVQVGAARVWKTSFGPAGESSGFAYSPYIEINDVETINSGLVSGNPNGHTIASEVLIWRNCKLDGVLWPSINRIFRAENCEVGGLIEIDKFIDRCEFINDTARGWLLYGTGCHSVVVDGGMYRTINLRSRTASIRNTTILSDPEHAHGAVMGSEGWPMRQMIFEGNTIVPHAGLLHVVNNIPTGAIEAGYEDAQKRIVLDDDSTARLIVKQLDIGSRVYRASPSESALVSRISWDADNSRWIIHFDDDPFSTTIQAEEAFSYYTVQRISYRANRKIGQTDLPAIRFDRADQIDTDDPTYSE